MFLQTTPTHPGDAPPPSLGGDANAHAIAQMGFDNLVHNFDALGWIVFITLLVMSLMSWYFIIANFIRNSMIRSRADKVIAAFWNNPSAQESIREMEAQPKSRAVLQDRPGLRLGRGPSPAFGRRPSGRVAEPLRVHRPRPAPGRGTREPAPGRRHDAAGHRRFVGAVRRPARYRVGHLPRPDRHRRQSAKHPSRPWPAPSARP